MAALCGQCTEAAVEQIFPKTPPLFRAVNGCFDAVAPAAGGLRHFAGVQRNQHFNNLPPFARQNRRRAAAGDGDFYRTPVDNGGNDKRTEFGVVHRITQFSARFGGLVDAAVEFVVVGGGNGQKHIIQISIMEFSA